MSFYFRDKPKFSDRLRGKSGEEILQEIKQQFNDDNKSFFEPRATREPFERHTGFSRGFPFDDDGFGRRSDIRAHLDDLASRHPEFADHLLGPPWGDIPFHGGNSRDRRRGSGSVSSHQNYPEDDTRSQASGSSAASGASAVSSHSEPDNNKSFPQEGFKNNIPQHGLRNTVDIGQHRHNMDNMDKGLRGQRSMSAPPENRQPVNPDQQQSSQGQRYVSRVDITPQNNQQSQQQSKPSQQQQTPQSNVRHIPIFVEGRDEPVLPKVAAEEPTQHHFQRQPSPPQFQRPSHYNQQYGGRPHQWPPQYQDPFFQTRFTDAFEPRRTHSPGYQRSPQRSEQYFESPQRQQKSEQQRHPPQQQHTSKQQQHQQQQEQQQQQQQQQPQQEQQQESQEPSKPKVPPPLPKDPLERVALVQKEVDSLAEQVKEFSGNSRKDKQYMYLDEMLTRELIKLDDIETEGRENVRQARKNAIKCIQNTISLLESKAPLPDQTPKPGEDKEEEPKNEEETKGEERMEVQRQTTPVETMEQEQSNGPIPLPPAPSSPVKKEQENAEQQQESQSEQLPSANKEDSSMDVQSNNNVEEKTQQSNQNHSEKQEETQQMDVEKPPSNKPPKKVKKSKKQKPISETPIPLPPPENIEENKK